MAYLDYALIEKSTLGDIGDAIREKTNGIKLLDPSKFASEIKRIPSEADKVPLQDKTVTKNGEITADDGYYGLGTVIVNVETGGSNDDGGESIVNRTIEHYSNDKLTKIGKYAFTQCGQLQSVNCPSVTYIDNNAFDNCTSLSSVDFSSVEYIGSNAFQSSGSFSAVFPETTSLGGSAFSSSDIVSASFPKVTTLNSSVFSYCTQLTNVNLPEVTQVYSSAFYNCSALEYISLPKLNELAGGMVFYYCTGLKTVDLPMLTAIRQSNTFSNTAIIDLTLPEVMFISSYNNTFSDMKSLKTLNLPKLINISGIKYMMKNDNIVETINIPNLETISNASEIFSPSLFNISLPSIKTITSSSAVFYSSGCDVNLRRIDLGHIETITSKSTSSSDNVFYRTNALLALIIRTESVVDITDGIKAITSYYSMPSNKFYIYVPASVIDNYKTTYSENSQLFRSIEDYPDICSTEWDRSFASVITYHTMSAENSFVNILVGKNEDAIQIGNNLQNGNMGLDTLVGWCDTLDVIGEEDIITECVIDGSNINLYGLYKRSGYIICYKPNSPVTRISDIPLYQLPYLKYESTGTTSERKYLSTNVEVPVEPDAIYGGIPFVGWGLHDSDDFTNLSNDDGTIMFNCLNCKNIEPMYNEGITFIYESGNEYNESKSVTHDRYYKPYSNKYQSLKVTMPDNTFVNPGYKFVAWENRRGTYTRYQPGDAFTVSSSYHDSINTEVTFIAIWEKETI